MNSKESLFFVAKCLTLDQHPERIEEVRDVIKNDEIDWENIVWVSSSQFVLPALYLHLKRHGLTEELPQDLIEHFKEITQLNRDRNKAIITQVKEITKSLYAHKIYPVFIKGVGHLLTKLYIDPAERMIGDIDFLVPANQMVQAAEILIKEGYVPLVEYHQESFTNTKHYPRLQNGNYTAAVEIHKEVLYPPKHKEFTGSEIIKDKIEVSVSDGKAYVPSNKHLIKHNVYNNQVNDKASILGEISLRQMFDLKLLALREDLIEIAQLNNTRFNLFNNYFALTAHVFSNPEQILYVQTWKVDVFVKKLNFYTNYPFMQRMIRVILFLYKRIARYISLPLKAIFKKDERVLLLKRLKNPDWYRGHFNAYISLFK